MELSHKIKSFILSFYVHIARVSDHLYRKLVGLPQIQRSEVTPHLYVGGQYASYGLPKLKKIRITSIVSMRERPIKLLPGIEFFTTLHLPTPDLGAPTITQLQKGAKFIHDEVEKGGKVYIHCHRGEGRGPTMAIAYLISTGMTFEDAFQSVKNVRTFINPTKVQIERLKEFETILNPSNV